jgi:hypothetical protein
MIKKAFLCLALAIVGLFACASGETDRLGALRQNLDFVCPEGCVCTCSAGSGGDAGSSGAGASTGGAGASGAAGASSGAGGVSGSADASAGNGGASGSGGAAGSAGSAGAGGSAGSAGAGGAAPTCDLSAYTPGVWRPTVTQPPLGVPGDGAGFGVAIDPNNPGKVWAGIYAGPAPGLYKTTNCGSSWSEVGTFAGVTQVRVNPANSNELYVGTGVGSAATNDFFYSSNGGTTWSARSSWSNALAQYDDVYSIAVDPTDFAHVLVAFHSPASGGAPGVGESFNKGVSWVEHLAISGWQGTQPGNTIAFLYDLASGQGNSQTWLYGTQGAGFWRTTNSGSTWTKVTTVNQVHGGNAIYYAPGGALFSGGVGYPIRSMDNGVTWTALTTAVYGHHMAVGGDGPNLFSGRWTHASSTSPLNVDTVADNGNSWSATGTANYGTFEFTKVDAVNGIMYAGMWESGVWAMKLQ